jgi:hypothetical protein
MARRSQFEGRLLAIRPLAAMRPAEPAPASSPVAAAALASASRPSAEPPTAFPAPERTASNASRAAGRVWSERLATGGAGDEGLAWTADVTTTDDHSRLVHLTAREVPRGGAFEVMGIRPGGLLRVTQGARRHPAPAGADPRPDGAAVARTYEVNGAARRFDGAALAGRAPPRAGRAALNDPPPRRTRSAAGGTSLHPDEDDWTKSDAGGLPAHKS